MFRAVALSGSSPSFPALFSALALALPRFPPVRFQGRSTRLRRPPLSWLWLFSLFLLSLFGLLLDWLTVTAKSTEIHQTSTKTQLTGHLVCFFNLFWAVAYSGSSASSPASSFARALALAPLRPMLLGGCSTSSPDALSGLALALPPFAPLRFRALGRPTVNFQIYQNLH